MAEGGEQCKDIQIVREQLPGLIKQVEEIRAIVSQVPELCRRLEKAEDKIDENTEHIAKLYTGLGETKVLVGQILTKLDNLETKIFSFLSQAVDRAAAATAGNNTEKSAVGINKELVDLIKYLVAVVLGGLIALLPQLLKGGKGP